MRNQLTIVYLESMSMHIMHTEQLEDPLVPYLERLMEGSELQPRCYPQHGHLPLLFVER